MIADILEEAGRDRGPSCQERRHDRLRRARRHRRRAMGEGGCRHRRHARRLRHPDQQCRHRDHVAGRRRQGRGSAPHVRRQYRRHRSRHEARVPCHAPGGAPARAAPSSISRRWRRRSRSRASPVYSGTKSAVDRMTRVAAMEAGKLGYGVRVNCIYPGLIATDMGMQLANDIVAVGLAADVDAAVGSVVEQTPLGRLARGHRHRRCRGVPVLGRGALHHRHRPAGRRRHGHVKQHATIKHSGGLQ